MIGRVYTLMGPLLGFTIMTAAEFTTQENFSNTARCGKHHHWVGGGVAPPVRRSEHFLNKAAAMHRLKALAKSVTVPTPTTSSDSFAAALRERSPTQAEAAAKKNAVDDVDDVIVIDAGVSQWRCGSAFDCNGVGLVLPGVPIDAEAYKAQMLLVLEKLELQPPHDRVALIMSEPPGTTNDTRDSIATMLFSLGVARLHIAAAPLLSIFSRSFVTGILLDVGERNTHVYAVYDGHCALPVNAAAVIPFAGGDLGWQSGPPPCDRLFERQADKRTKLAELVTIKVKQLKEKIATLEAEGNTSRAEQLRDMLVELEMRNAAAAQDAAKDAATSDVGGVHEAILQVVSLADVSLRRALLAHIVCVGGGSLAIDMPERLERELRSMPELSPCMPQVFANSDRRFACWMGGSMLAGLSSGRLQFVSHDEYRYFPELLHRRCAPLACYPLTDLRSKCTALARDEAIAEASQREHAAREAEITMEDARSWWMAQAPEGSRIELLRQRSLQQRVVRSLRECACRQAGVASGRHSHSQRPPPLSAEAALALAGRTLQILGSSLSLSSRLSSNSPRGISSRHAKLSDIVATKVKKLEEKIVALEAHGDTSRAEQLRGMLVELQRRSVAVALDNRLRDDAADEALWRRLSHLQVAEWASSAMCHRPESHSLVHVNRTKRRAIRRGWRWWKWVAVLSAKNEAATEIEAVAILNALRSRQVLARWWVAVMSPRNEAAAVMEVVAILNALRARQVLARWFENVRAHQLAERSLCRFDTYVQHWRGFRALLSFGLHQRRQQLVVVTLSKMARFAHHWRGFARWMRHWRDQRRRHLTAARACRLSFENSFESWVHSAAARTALELSKTKVRYHLQTIARHQIFMAWRTWSQYARAALHEATLARRRLTPFLESLAIRTARNCLIFSIGRWIEYLAWLDQAPTLQVFWRARWILARRRNLVYIRRWRRERRIDVQLKMGRREILRAFLGRWIAAAWDLRLSTLVKASATAILCHQASLRRPRTSRRALRAKTLAHGMASFKVGVVYMASRAYAHAQSLALRRRFLVRWKGQVKEELFGRWEAEARYRCRLGKKVQSVVQLIKDMRRARVNAEGRSSLLHWQKQARSMIENQECLRCQLWYLEELRRSVLNFQNRLLLGGQMSSWGERLSLSFTHLLSVGVEAALLSKSELRADKGGLSSLCMMASRAERQCHLAAVKLECICPPKQRGAYRHDEREALSGTEIMRRIQVASAAWGTANNTIDTEVKRRLQVQAGTRAIPPRTAWGAPDNEIVVGARSPSRQLELQAGLAIEWKPF